MSEWVDEAGKIKAALRYEPLKILVWGPGDPGSSATPECRKAYEKRLQIKQILADKFRCSEVYFSEDPEMVQISEGIRGQLRKEVLQARIADLIIMLDISRGADLELDHFVPTYPWFRDKVYVFLPEQFVPPHGLVREVFDHLTRDQVEGFSTEEFERCSLATEKAVQIAESFALIKKLR